MSLIFDASTLISFSQSCLLEILLRLQKHLDEPFVVSKTVYDEIITNPLRIRRFELNAVRLARAVDTAHIQIVEPTPLERARTNELSVLANQAFAVGHHSLTIVHGGEAESLSIASERDIEILAMDERTTRMLIETPAELQKLLSERNQKPVEMHAENIHAFNEPFQRLTIVRSVELLALAYQNRLFEPTLSQKPQSLEAALFALKFAGCAVSENEIDEFLQTREKRNDP